MTTTHELGHLIGGYCGGAKLTDFDLAPWRLPYSFHHPDPYPLLTLWSGPLIGIALPALLAGFIRRHWAVFVADFCLLANGCYLALAWLTEDPLLDTARLMDAGAHPFSIVVFCVLAIGIGYARFRRDCVRLFQTQRDDLAKS
ncbi:hypothetical protein NHH03_10035 [Stieleria sp. TO1_6]|uniref:hypothetical protein n=1 Tax=Stieleria tagensis TaxID=2956795 RepID=UPI00209AD2A2|nr:hypothetical protein [Stieleria tagensis]MCO8122077.1 hypothetical protein [Stieleria tagensis]